MGNSNISHIKPGNPHKTGKTMILKSHETIPDVNLATYLTDSYPDKAQ